jgi:hypothetical protein
MLRRIACGLSVLGLMFSAPAPAHADGLFQRILGIGNQSYYPQSYNDGQVYSSQPVNNYPQSYDGQGYSGQQPYNPNYPQSGGMVYSSRQRPYSRTRSPSMGMAYSSQPANNYPQSYDDHGYSDQQQSYPQANYGQRQDMEEALVEDHQLAREAQQVAVRNGHAAWRSRLTNASGIEYVESGTPPYSPDGVSKCRMVREEMIDARGNRHDNRGQVCIQSN